MPQNWPRPYYIDADKAFKHRAVTRQGHFYPVVRGLINFMLDFQITCPEMAFNGPLIVEAAMDAGYLPSIRSKNYEQLWYRNARRMEKYGAIALAPAKKFTRKNPRRKSYT